MKQRILITGANGFIGRHLVSTLAGHDVELVLVVRAGSEPAESALDRASKVISSPDIFSEPPQWWAEKLEDVDTVIHTAWYTNPADYMTSNRNQRCEIGTLRLASGLLMTKVRRFVGIGTCLEYEQKGATAHYSVEVAARESLCSSKGPDLPSAHQAICGFKSSVCLVSAVLSVWSRRA